MNKRKSAIIMLSILAGVLLSAQNAFSHGGGSGGHGGGGGMSHASSASSHAASSTRSTSAHMENHGAHNRGDRDGHRHGGRGGYGDDGLWIGDDGYDCDPYYDPYCDGGVLPFID